MTRLINIDNGGTLTDFCLVEDGEVRYTKTLTTPYDLSRCLFDGLTKVSELAYSEPRLAALLQSTDCIRYSTTQGTNALVQRAGPQLGLLVTDPTLVEGLAATQAQEDLLAALVGDRWGQISLDADDEALGRDLLARVNDLSARGARRLVIAVSGADGSRGEARVKGLLLRLYPRHLLGAVPLLFSWELIADPDDIRRTWSGLLNAFLHPAMERFLFNADRRLRDARARQPLRIFRNDGASSRVSKSAALKTYSSGPRGGLEGTRALADHYGLRHLVMLDVGGTTTDIGVVSDGAIHVERRGTIEHAPSSLELAAITSYGVGGSSVFRVVDGRLRVGPDSVGAAPGPACFGLGGDQPTITDVLLLAGLLDPATYLGGTLPLYPDRGAKVIEDKIAGPLGIPLDDALRQMEDAHAAAIAHALGDATTVTGDTVLAAFGGAGPMTVCGAARRAGARHVLIPRTAAVFSAFGIGFSDLGQRYEQPLPAVDYATISDVARPAAHARGQGHVRRGCRRERVHAPVQADGRAPGRGTGRRARRPARCHDPPDPGRPGIPGARAAGAAPACHPRQGRRRRGIPGGGRGDADAARWPWRAGGDARVRTGEPAPGRARDRAGCDRRPVLHHAGPAGLAVRHHRSG